MTRKPKPSTTIRQRIEDAGDRYWSNDNISQHLQPGDLKALTKEATRAYGLFLDALLIDWRTDPNAMETAQRVAKMYINELLVGRTQPMPKITVFPNIDAKTSKIHYDGLQMMRVDIHSICSHHHQAVTGNCYIGVVSAQNLLGLSKFHRLAHWMARRGTLQETLTTDLADLISEKAETESVGVFISARHGCCEHRGVNTANSLTSTTELRGTFFEDERLRREFYSQIQLMQNSINHG